MSGRAICARHTVFTNDSIGAICTRRSIFASNNRGDDAMASSPLLLLAKMDRRVQMAPMESLVKTVCLAQMARPDKTG